MRLIPRCWTMNMICQPKACCQLHRTRSKLSLGGDWRHENGFAVIITDGQFYYIHQFIVNSSQLFPTEKSIMNNLSKFTNQNPSEWEHNQNVYFILYIKWMDVFCKFIQIQPNKVRRTETTNIGAMNWKQQATSISQYNGMRKRRWLIYNDRQLIDRKKNNLSCCINLS